MRTLLQLNQCVVVEITSHVRNLGSSLLFGCFSSIIYYCHSGSFSRYELLFPHIRPNDCTKYLVCAV